MGYLFNVFLIDDEQWWGVAVAFVGKFAEFYCGKFETQADKQM